MTPALASAMGGISQPVVDSLTVPSPAPANSQVTVSCAAHDPGPGTSVTVLQVTVNGGTLGTGGTSVPLAISPGASVSGSITWNTPGPGSYTVTCVAQNDALFPVNSQPMTANVTVAVLAPPPVVDGLVATDSQLFPGDLVHLEAAAHDPSGLALTYGWTAGGGTLLNVNGSQADWLAPAGLGSYQVTVTVDDGVNGTASATLSLQVVLAKPSAAYALPAGRPFLPGRLAVDSRSTLYVTDSRAGTVEIFAANGQWVRRLALGGRPEGIAVDGRGRIFVGDAQRQMVHVFDGLQRSALGQGAGEVALPDALAIDNAGGRIFVAEGRAGTVKVYGANLSLQGTLPVGGFVSGLAYDAGSGRLFVADGSSGTIRVLDGAGAVSATLGGFGSGPGMLTRLGGIALDPSGRLFAVDAYQGAVSVFGPAGSYLASLGSYGHGRGQLALPLDAVVDGFGRVLVSNGDQQRVEVYSSPGTPAQTACPGDADCDGIPDSVELAWGLNPNNPADAWLDPDGDGLSNLEEYRLGTDPHNPDTDGDGIPDGAEVLAGTNPLDASDNRPVAVAEGPSQVRPSRVVLDGSASHDPNGDTLTYSWRQVSGPAQSKLLDASAAKLSVVLRQRGDYVFGLKVNDGKVFSLEALVAVTVENLGPRADAGPLRGGKVGRAVTLDGRFSADPNLDPLSFTWRQIDGPSATLDDAKAAAPRFTPSAAGVYAFELTVDDGLLSSAPARANVVVDDDTDHVPTATCPEQLEARLGESVSLSGALSADADGDALFYSWRQLDGPAVSLSGDNAMAVSFSPPAAGTYRFELTVSDGRHRGLPKVATVLVSDGSTAPAIAEAGYDQRGQVLSPVTLNGSGSSGGSQPISAYRWSQLEGPPVELSISGPQATFLPLDPGTYAFELEVANALGAGTRDRVTVTVDDAPSELVPLLVASASPAIEGDGRIELLARPASSYPALSYLWTQLAGPHLILDGADQARATFQVPQTGLYVFEVRADDGAVRGPPTRVVWQAGTPVARIGPDLMVLPGLPAILDASLSTASGGAPLRFAWRQVGGPRDAELSGLDSSKLTLVAARSGYTLRFAVSASDGRLEGAPAEVNVSVVDVPLLLQELGPAGGTLTLSAAGSLYDGLSVTIPEGALAAPAQIAVGAITRDWFQRPGAESLQPALFVGPVGQRFLKPLNLAIPLGDKPRARGLTADQIDAMVFDHDADQWLAGAAQIDLANNRAVLSTEKPAVVQLLAPEAQAIKGCGCGSSGGVEVGLALLALPLLLRRRRRSAAVVAVAAAMLVGGQASALDPPHDGAASRVANGCVDCHIGHKAPGMQLTTTAGNATLCISCHTSHGAFAWSSSDQATPGAMGASHHWDSAAANGRWGAGLPAAAEMAKRLEGTAKLMNCSVCHDEHNGAAFGGTQKLSAVTKVAGTGTGTLTVNAPAAAATSKSYLIDVVAAGAAGTARFRLSNDNGYSWFGYSAGWVAYTGANGQLTGTNVALNDGTNVTVNFAGTFAVGDRFDFYVTYPLLRAANADSAMCEDCHTARKMTDAHLGADGIKVFSHPVGVALSNGYDRASSAILDANGALQTTGDGLKTNDLVLGSGNSVHCMTCHHPHGADSNSLTEDAR